MKRTKLTENVSWLITCHEEHGRMSHLSQFVIQGTNANVLIDAGHADPDEMVEAINDVTDGAGIDVLLMTHAMLPHTENVRTVMDEWGAEVISSSPIAVMVGLPETAKPKKVNATEEIAGRTFTFLDPLLTDVIISNWIFDHESGILFTAEGPGHYHDETECQLTSAEMDDGIDFDDIHQFNEDKLPFLEVVDPAKLQAGFDAVFETLDVEYIAPMHGNPVHQDDLDDYIGKLIESVSRFKSTAETRA